MGPEQMGGMSQPPAEELDLRPYDLTIGDDAMPILAGF
jgi:hypothetical protein